MMLTDGRRSSRILSTLVAVLCALFLMSCENALEKSAESLRSGAVLAHASPSGLHAEEANHQVRLDWDKVDGATSYTLYWSTAPITTLVEANAVSLTTNYYTHTGLQNGKALYYSVAAHGFDAESQVSKCIVALPHQYMAYVTNGGVSGSECNAVGYTLNGEDGSLVELGGYSFDVGSYPKKIVTDPSRRFAYISSFNNQKITCYKIDSDTGRLVPIGSPVSAGSGVSSLAVDPSGKYLYAVNSTNNFPNGNSVSAYAIDQSTGSLSSISGSPFAAGSYPNGIAIDPTGRFVYVPANDGGSGTNIGVFSISGSGALAKSSDIVAGAGVCGIAIHPKGKFLYPTFWNGATDAAVQALTLNTTDGLLLGGQVTRTYNILPRAPGNFAEVVEIDPTGRFLYVCLYSKTKIAIYSIDQTSGDLTPLSGSPFQLWPATPAEIPNAIGFDPEGKFAFIVTALADTPYTGALRCFSIDQESGGLSAVGSPRTLGKNSCDIEIISLP